MLGLQFLFAAVFLLEDTRNSYGQPHVMCDAMGKIVGTIRDTSSYSSFLTPKFSNYVAELGAAKGVGRLPSAMLATINLAFVTYYRLLQQ